jgi:hypothetical protein
MNNQTRKRTMEYLRESAQKYDKAGDVVMRTLAANEWFELAKPSEARRAPAYLTWKGRENG